MYLYVDGIIRVQLQIPNIFKECNCWGSSVTILTRLQARRPEFDLWQGYRDQTGSEAHPDSYPMGTRDKSAGL